MKNIFLKTLSSAINAFLKLDPESKNRFKTLEGKIIVVELLPIKFIFNCQFNTSGVSIKAGKDLTPDATIVGTPLQMLNLMLAKDNRHTFFSDDLRIEGNAEVAQKVIELFDELHIDWEDYFSLLVGDAAAFKAGNFLKKIKSWIKYTEESMQENVKEYIHEEVQWLPGKEILQDFFKDIDELRMDVDRLQARTSQLLMTTSTPQSEDKP